MSLKKQSQQYYLLFNLPLQILSVILLFFINNWVIFLISFVIFYILVYWLGIQAGYHRLFSHKTWYPKNDLIKYFIAWLGCHGLMGGLIVWSQMHRHHHIHSDTEKDLHSPKKGIINAYFLWLLKIPPLTLITIKDFLKDKILVKIDNNCRLIVLLTLIVLFFLNVNLAAGLTFHSEMAVNAFLHKKVNDKWVAQNNKFLSLFTGGSTLHKNHHDDLKLNNFSKSKFEIDGSYFFVKLLQK
jgi:stearoyl-CoA desaturase (delta-9 desaturase)